MLPTAKTKRIITYTWSEFDFDVRHLAEALSYHSESFDNIYALPRGGLVLGVALSHALGLKLTTKDNVTSRTLVVDEISDSGETLKKFIESYGFPERHRPFTVTLHAKLESAYLPNLYCREVISGDWINYPWEKEELTRKCHGKNTVC